MLIMQRRDVLDLKSERLVNIFTVAERTDLHLLAEIRGVLISDRYFRVRFVLQILNGHERWRRSFIVVVIILPVEGLLLFLAILGNTKPMAKLLPGFDYRIVSCVFHS